MFSKRAIKPELLDKAPPDVARPSLLDLMRINRNLGGLRVIRKTLGRAAIGRSEDFTLLDVGAASGDTGREIIKWYPRARVTSFDRNETNLAWADKPKVVGDAFQLPFAADSFDYVLCSLFLHHFCDDSVIELIRAFYQISRRAILLCDLERRVTPYVFLPATRFLFKWQDITVHDGRISVRASFRADELQELSRRAGVLSSEVKVHRPAFRVALVAFKNGRK